MITKVALTRLLIRNSELLWAFRVAAMAAQKEKDEGGEEGGDPFNSPDFKVTEYVNKLFPNGEGVGTRASCGLRQSYRRPAHLCNMCGDPPPCPPRRVVAGGA